MQNVCQPQSPSDADVRPEAQATCAVGTPDIGSLSDALALCPLGSADCAVCPEPSTDGNFDAWLVFESACTCPVIWDDVPSCSFITETGGDDADARAFCAEGAMDCTLCGFPPGGERWLLVNGAQCDCRAAQAALGPDLDNGICPPSDTPLEILQASVEGSLLTMEIQYTGGCTEHAFAVGWDGIIATSDPAIAPVEIHHYDFRDPCTEVVRETLHVDLSALDSQGHVFVDLLSAERTLDRVEYDASADPVELPPDALPILDICAHLEP